jgi:hypothetical protein
LAAGLLQAGNNNMATYGYSAGYQGGGPQPVAPGYIDAYAQAGRNIGAGMQSIGSAIGSALQRYGEKKAENEFLTQRLESLAPYLQTVAQTGNVMDERSPESKLLGDIEKFSSMSIPQKKATLLNAEFYLDRTDKQRARELTDEATRQQLALGALQLGEAQREEAGAPYFTQAMMDLYARQPGQGPTAPYADVTQEVIDKYRGKMTQKQVQALIPMLRRAGQAIPAGLVPTGAKMGPSGLETEYGAPPVVTSTPIPGTDLVQPMVGPKPSGSPVPASPKIQSKIDNLPEEKRKWANDTLNKLREDKQFAALDSRTSEFAALQQIAAKENPSPADDIALIIRFNKTMDPAGAVLEGEFKRSVEGGSVTERVRQLFEYYTEGRRLTPKMRKDIVDSAKSIVDAYVPSVAGRINDEIVAAKYRGVPEDAVIPDSMLNFLKTKGNLPSLNKSQDSIQEGQTSGGVKYKVLKK